MRRSETGTVSPPAIKISVRHPIIGKTIREISPAIRVSNGMQTIVNISANTHFFGYVCTTAIAAAFGIARPRPSPARKRNALSCHKPLIQPVAKVIKPNNATALIGTVCRPMRSPRIPAIMVPTLMPMRLIVAIGAIAPFAIPYSVMRAGVAKPST